MGVIRKITNLPDPFQAQDDVLEELVIRSEERDVEERAPSGTSPRRQRRPRPQHDCCTEVVGLSARGKHKSSKKCRRLENANYLQSLAEGEDLSQVSIYDFVRDSVSAFSRLLGEPENRQIWEDFLDCSEKLEHEKDSEEPLTGMPTSTMADSCFQKLDSSLRSILRKQHVPLVTNSVALSFNSCQ